MVIVVDKVVSYDTNDYGHSMNLALRGGSLSANLNISSSTLRLFPCTLRGECQSSHSRHCMASSVPWRPPTGNNWPGVLCCGIEFCSCSPRIICSRVQQHAIHASDLAEVIFGQLFGHERTSRDTFRDNPLINVEIVCQDIHSMHLGLCLSYCHL